MKKTILLTLVLLLSICCSFAGNVVVGTKTYPVDTLAHYKVGPGTYYTALHFVDATNPLRIFLLEADATNPYISFKSVLGKDSTVTCERPSDMAKRKTKAGEMYIAGTNADFFNTKGQIGLPVAGCMVDGEVGLIPNSRPDIAFERNLIPFIGTNTFAGKVSFAGNSFSISNVNTTRNPDQLVLYNNLNGKYTHTNSNGTEVLVRLVDNKWAVNKTLKCIVLSVVPGVGNMLIPSGDAVLSGQGTAQTYLNTLKVNGEVEIHLGITMNNGGEKPVLTDLVGGDRLILLDGQVTDNDWVKLNPRTAMGFSADKRKIYFCVVDGRSQLSVGVSTKQLADIMKSAGAYTAINLDGGGSSCMYVKELNVMNVTSDGKERPVGNGIFAVSSAPVDTVICEIKPYQYSNRLSKSDTFIPKFLGYNKYGTILKTDMQGVVMTCDPKLGTITGKGEFVASGDVDGILNATYKGLRTQVAIRVNKENTIVNP
jgi:hypothetical protein